MGIVNRGSRGRRAHPGAGLLPPGQCLVEDFPVLTAGPSPTTPLEGWDFTVVDENGTQLARWTWEELLALPAEDVTVDIHCVTKWSKLATRWRGVSLDVLLAGFDDAGEFVLGHCDGAYTTNLPPADVLGGQDAAAGRPGAYSASSTRRMPVRATRSMWRAPRVRRCTPRPAPGNEPTAG